LGKAASDAAVTGEAIQEKEWIGDRDLQYRMASARRVLNRPPVGGHDPKVPH
jgi:hypothetical protein